MARRWNILLSPSSYLIKSSFPRILHPRWRHFLAAPPFERRNLATASFRNALRQPKTVLTPPRLRSFTTTPPRSHNPLTPPAPGQERHITFLDKTSTPHTFVVSDGENLLDIAQAHDLEMEGACGGSCACSTCHVIVQDEEMYDRMEEPSDDENDMLDLAFGLTETSRLGCQVKMTRELDGLVVSSSLTLGTFTSSYTHPYLVGASYGEMRDVARWLI